MSDEPRTADFFRVVIKFGIYAILISAPQQIMQNWKLVYLLLILCGFPSIPSTALKFDYS
ncbi:MAG: hypothetical protein A2Z02_02530 [Chloroflexi bacterium RBG_16_48_7]|nr:MAG: hypothetical protein A2Z02_02530 [Chloroflexi bacterium RBG_16_48_7]